jgi:hypothetical protein
MLKQEEIQVKLEKERAQHKKVQVELEWKGCSTRMKGCSTRRHR